MIAYRELIKVYTGVTDNALLNDIEEIMRLKVGGSFEHLTWTQFTERVKEAEKIAARVDFFRREGR
jgi:hypothetical protein